MGCGGRWMSRYLRRLGEIDIEDGRVPKRQHSPLLLLFAVVLLYFISLFIGLFLMLDFILLVIDLLLMSDLISLVVGCSLMSDSILLVICLFFMSKKLSKLFKK